MTIDNTARVLLAESIEQTLQWKAEHGVHARFAGGGTDLLLQARAGKHTPDVFIRLPQVAADVAEENGFLVLPALATLADLAVHPLVQAHVPVLAQAMTQIGSPQIRNVATLAGNLCNASPAADSAPALLVYEAAVVLASVRGSRELPLDQFFAGPGKTALAPDELLLHVKVPLALSPAPTTIREVALFRKFGPRGANVISAASFAARIRLLDNAVTHAFLAAGSVGPRPLRLRNTEQALVGRGYEEPATSGGLDAANRTSERVVPGAAPATHAETGPDVGAGTPDGMVPGAAPGTPAETGPDAGTWVGLLLQALRKDISPISDVRGSGWYKGEVIERCLAWLGERLGGGDR